MALPLGAMSDAQLRAALAAMQANQMALIEEVQARLVGLLQAENDIREELWTRFVRGRPN